MPLRIQLAKRPEGAVLRCIRADGSATWRKHERHAGHFALHDLTHFAVESALGCQEGFFGLVAKGWDLEDTTGKKSRGPLPHEAAEVEYLVGVFDSERAAGVLWSAAEFNEHAALHASASGRPAPRRLTAEDLIRVRALRAELFARWRGVETGGALELQFPALEVNAPGRSSSRRG